MSYAFIANELNIRLLEHAPNAILPSKKLELLQANIQKKYQEAEFDCVIAPLILISEKGFHTFFQEVRRILSPQGFFLFSTLGSEGSPALEILGDALLQAGFQLPVVDREILQLHYDDINVLLNDLEQSGLNEKLVHVTKKSSEDIMATIDVIYGYTLGSTINSLTSGKIEIPVETIKIRKPHYEPNISTL